MNRKTVWLTFVLAGGAVLILGAAQQITRQEFDALAKRVERLEARLDAIAEPARGVERAPAPSRKGTILDTSDTDGGVTVDEGKAITLEVTQDIDLTYHELEDLFLRMTSAQWNELVGKLKGWRVEWTGTVVDVAGREGKIPIWIEVPLGHG